MKVRVVVNGTDHGRDPVPAGIRAIRDEALAAFRFGTQSPRGIVVRLDSIESSDGDGAYLCEIVVQGRLTPPLRFSAVGSERAKLVTFALSRARARLGRRSLRPSRPPDRQALDPSALRPRLVYSGG